MNPWDLTHTMQLPICFQWRWKSMSLTCFMTHHHPPQAESHKQSRPKSTLTSCRKEEAHPSCPCHCHLHPLRHLVHGVTKRDLRGRKSMEELGYRLINSLINTNSNQFTELTALVTGLYKQREKGGKSPNGMKSSSNWLQHQKPHQWQATIIAWIYMAHFHPEAWSVGGSVIFLNWTSCVVCLFFFF